MSPYTRWHMWRARVALRIMGEEAARSEAAVKLLMDKWKAAHNEDSTSTTKA